MDKKRQKKFAGQKARRVARVRVKVKGSAKRPRFAVQRSLQNISVQLIDDQAGKTLVAAHQRELKKKKITKQEAAVGVGKLIAKKAEKAEIKTVVFDRRHNKYHGRIKAVADAAREAGLKF